MISGKLYSIIKQLDTNSNEWMDEWMNEHVNKQINKLIFWAPNKIHRNEWKKFILHNGYNRITPTMSWNLIFKVICFVIYLPYVLLNQPKSTCHLPRCARTSGWMDKIQPNGHKTRGQDTALHLFPIEQVLLGNCSLV